MNLIGYLLIFQEDMSIGNNGVERNTILGEKEFFVAVAVVTVCRLPCPALNGMGGGFFICWKSGKTFHSTDGIAKGVSMNADFTHKDVSRTFFFRIKTYFEILCRRGRLGVGNSLFVSSQVTGVAVLVCSSMADRAGNSVLMQNMFRNRSLQY